MCFHLVLQAYGLLGHPGDPIAYPLEKLLPQLVDEHSEYIDVRDIPIQTISLTELLTEPFSQTLFALLHSGAAHDSYWNSAQVAKQIATAIEAS